MPRFNVMFERDSHDEILPANADETARYTQLRKEMSAAGFHLPPVHFGYIQVGGNYDVFAVSLEYPGSLETLRDELQRAYDDFGAAGFFNITEA